MDQTSRLNFLCDPRVQLLSAQEESFLFRLFEARMRNELSQYGGRFPTDPKLLRPIAYPHKPGPRDQFLRCLISKLEQVRIATMIPPAPCAVFDLPDYLPIQCEEITGTDAQGRGGIGLIHNRRHSGSDPPTEIIAVAAAATSVSGFIGRARELGFYEGFDLEKEWNDYVDHRRKKNRPSTLQNFAEIWMPRMQRRFGKIKVTPSAPKRSEITPIVSVVPDDDQPDLFEELTHKRFLAEKEARKVRAAQAMRKVG